MLNKLIATTFAGLMALPALAATQTWTIQGGDISGTGQGNYISKTVGGVGLTLTGWADTGGVTNDKLRTGTLMHWNCCGLGMMNRKDTGGAPDHSIDSTGGNGYDMVLLSFDTAVNLSGFNVGWALENNTHRRADVSVLAYTGSSTFNTFGSAQTWASLVATNGGWTSQGNFADVNEYSYRAVSSSVTSKHWLIGAYNSLFGTGAGLTAGNDGFKLAAFKTSTPHSTVPVPGTLAVLAAGLMALVGARRKRLVA